MVLISRGKFGPLSLQYQIYKISFMVINASFVDPPNRMDTNVLVESSENLGFQVQD